MIDSAGGGYYQVVIDVLKLDIEAAEWPFLRDAVLRDEGHQLSTVRQLLLELHSPRYVHKDAALSAADLAEMILYIQRLNQLGFALFRSVTSNNCCARFKAMMPHDVPERCCVESLFLNTHL